MKKDEYKSQTADNLPDNINDTVDIAVFAGQSNMSGRGSKADAVVCAAGAGFEYKSVSDPHRLVSIAEPFGLDEDLAGGICDKNGDGLTKRTGSMVSAVVDEYYRNTGRQLVAVSASVGGTTTAEWKEIYISDAVSRLERAKAFLRRNGISADRIFIVWSQGESDADNAVTAEVYTQNTMELFSKFKAHGAQKCFIVQTGHYNYNRSGASKIMDNNYGVIRDAQAALCGGNDDFVMAASFEPYIYDMQDLYHYNQGAYNAVGKTAGENIAKYYN